MTNFKCLKILIVLLGLFHFSVQAKSHAKLPIIIKNNGLCNVSFHSIRGINDTITIGDVVNVDGFNMVLRELTDTLYLLQEGNADELLFLTDKNNNNKKLIAIKIYQKVIYNDKYQPIDTTTANPLKTLNTLEINGLWGIQFNYFTQNIKEKLRNARFDSTAYFFSFDPDKYPNFNHSLIPENTVYLIISTNFSYNYNNADDINKFKFLQYFKVNHSLGSSTEFDLKIIEHCNNLLFLSIEGGNLVNINSIKNLTNLKSLTINFL